VSWKSQLRVIFACVVLEVGALAGVPMRPEQIKDLMQAFNQPRVVHVLPSEDETGNDDPP
jgi:hypothetical protein